MSAVKRYPKQQASQLPPPPRAPLPERTPYLLGAAAMFAVAATAAGAAYLLAPAQDPKTIRKAFSAIPFGEDPPAGGIIVTFVGGPSNVKAPIVAYSDIRDKINFTIHYLSGAEEIVKPLIIKKLLELVRETEGRKLYYRKNSEGELDFEGAKSKAFLGPLIGEIILG